MAIRPSDIEDYVGKRRKSGLSNATTNQELAALKRMFKDGGTVCAPKQRQKAATGQ